jgi:hypothetical protein
MSLTYILIDFENVQPTAADVSLIRGSDYRVLLFHGPHQNKFDAGMVKALQPLGVHLEYFQCERRGKNALDFHIAFCLGRLVEESKTAASTSKKAKFVIVSKDGGFDVLLDHVETLGYGAMRVENVHEALVPDKNKGAAGAKEPAVKTTRAPKKSAPSKTEGTVMKGSAANAPSQNGNAKPETAPKRLSEPDPWQRVIANLRDHPNNRPTTSAALERHVTTLLGKDTAEKVVKALISRLQKEGVVVLKGKKIEYKLTVGTA